MVGTVEGGKIGDKIYRFFSGSVCKKQSKKSLQVLQTRTSNQTRMYSEN